MAKKAREKSNEARLSVSIPPCLHPVQLLKERLEKAWHLCSGLESGWGVYHRDHLEFDRNCGDPAARAIEVAIEATKGIGRSLCYGMGDRAGTFETELRRELGLTHRGVHFVGIMPPEALREWQCHYDSLIRLYDELSEVAVASELVPWEDKLNRLYCALTGVKDAMCQLREAAIQRSESLSGLADRFRAEALTDFAEALSAILPQIAYALEQIGGDGTHLQTLVRRFDRCAEELLTWGRRRREHPEDDVPFEPSRMCRATEADMEELLWWLGNAPKAGEADTSSEGKESRLQRGGGAAEVPEPVAATADEAVKRIGSEWATNRQLAEITGMSESALRAATKRALDKRKLLKTHDIKPLTETRSGTARQMIRIRRLWPHLSCARERSEN